MWERSLTALTALNLHFLQGPQGPGLPGRRGRLSFAMNSALSSQSKSTQWLQALGTLTQLRCVAFRPDIISLHVVINSLSWSWKRALESISSCKFMALEPDQAAWQMTASACKDNWRWPLTSLHHMSQLQFPKFNLALHTSCIDSCRFQWTSALGLLDELHLGRVAVDAACYRAAVGACVACSERDAALSILLEERGVSSAIDHLWILAHLPKRDPLQIRQAVFETYALLKGGFLEHSEHSNIPSITASEIAACWWSLASLGVVPKRFGDLLLLVSRQLLGRSQLHELMLIAWGAAGVSGNAAELLLDIQQKATQIEDELAQSEQCELHVDFIQRILGIVWSCQQQGVLGAALYQKTQKLLAASGKTKLPDVSAQFPKLPASQSMESQVSAPLVVYESLDKLVLYKPPGWEVHDGSHSQQLLTFLRRSGRRQAILKDRFCSFGFLHRLDVPSSGLILVAKSYEAFYNLQLELAAGSVLRDYMALCHGFLSERSSIHAPVTWQVSQDPQPGMLSFCNGAGKHATTNTQAIQTFFAKGDQTAATLLQIRIQTGRRHQIRSHLALIGHPLFCDGKYTAEGVFQSDKSRGMNRNFLHRHHLAFKDQSKDSKVVEEPKEMDLSLKLDWLDLRLVNLPEDLQDVYHPLPKDLQHVLRSNFSPKRSTPAVCVVAT